MTFGRQRYVPEIDVNNGRTSQLYVHFWLLRHNIFVTFGKLDIILGPILCSWSVGGPVYFMSISLNL